MYIDNYSSGYRRNNFDIVDLQNAALSGGVAVGAIADLMIQPHFAFMAGSVCGVVSTLGYKVLQVYILRYDISMTWKIITFLCPEK